MQWVVKTHQKNIKGINLFLTKNKSNKDYFFNIFGDEEKINLELKKYKIPDKYFKNFIHLLPFVR